RLTWLPVRRNQAGVEGKKTGEEERKKEEFQEEKGRKERERGQEKEGRRTEEEEKEGESGGEKESFSSGEASGEKPGKGALDLRVKGTQGYTHTRRRVSNTELS
ncbi:hypothetical protein NPIL_640501, partial [Nephila pilipes]